MGTPPALRDLTATASIHRKISGRAFARGTWTPYWATLQVARLMPSRSAASRIVISGRARCARSRRAQRLQPCQSM